MALTPAQPFEACHLPPVDVEDPQTREALDVLLTAVNGFAYEGHGQYAILAAIRALRARPDVAVALGINDPNSPGPYLGPRGGLRHRCECGTDNPVPRRGGGWHCRCGRSYH